MYYQNLSLPTDFVKELETKNQPLPIVTVYHYLHYKFFEAIPRELEVVVDSASSFLEMGEHLFMATMEQLAKIGFVEYETTVETDRFDCMRTVLYISKLKSLKE